MHAKAIIFVHGPFRGIKAYRARPYAERFATDRLIRNKRRKQAGQAERLHAQKGSERFLPFPRENYVQFAGEEAGRGNIARIPGVFDVYKRRQ